MGRDACEGELLNALEAITIRLPDGSSVEISPDAELAIPDDDEGVWYAARHAPARLDFIATQVERQYAAVRTLERELRRVEAEIYVTHRQLEIDNPDRPFPTERFLTSCVDFNRRVIARRKQLSTAKKHVGILIALRDAARYRCSILSNKVREVKLNA